ncbi:retrovirus-related pol polyprotein from transposon TNT 1-94 [Tanacetum coccineum]|uniref:Retrovirus-related pol polyprotein from transposon TNT 1-94 n=1 Tax=Tanacetum coccineum TaxID=301880 RepID=A0ABQ5D3F6_9ASTR
MTTLAEHMIVAGADNCPPMLEKSMYNSWQNRMLIYIKGKEHGRTMLNSVLHVTLVYGTIEVDGVTRTKTYEELTDQEKLQDDCDVRAMNIVLQGLPPAVYPLVNHHHVAKEIWDQVKLLMQGIELSQQKRERHMARQCTQPKRPRNSAWFKEKILLVQAHKSGQTDDLDAFDSDCDEPLGSKAVLIANLSSYNSNIISKTESATVQDTTSTEQQNYVIMLVFDKITSQVAKCNDESIKNKNKNESLTTELERYKERISNTISEQLVVPPTPVKIEVPIELPKKCFEIQKKEVFLENDQLLELIISHDIVHTAVNSLEVINDYESMRKSYCEEYNQNLTLKAELLIMNELSKICSRLQNHCISLELKLQQNKESFQNNRTCSNLDSLTFNEFFVKNNLKAQLQAKESSIRSLRAHIATLKGKNVLEINVPVTNATVIAPGMFRLDLEPLSSKLKNNKEAHEDYLQKAKEHTDTLRGIVEQARKLNPNDPYLEYALIPSTSASGSQSKNNTRKNKITPTASSHKKNKTVEVHPRKVMSSLNKRNHVSMYNENSKHAVKDVNSKFVCSTCNSCLFSATYDKCVVAYINDMNKRVKSKYGKSKKMEWKPTGKVFTSIRHRFSNDQIAKIMEYGDYQIENVIISKVYYVEGLGFRDTNLYTLSLDDMMRSSPICLLSKASKTKSWLWNRRLSHLNFATINELAKQGLVRGLPKLKYEKDHLCSACSLGKSKKHTHKPKSEDSIQEKLYLLHMDLCGLMRIESINWKKYILVIVDDYSRFTLVKFLQSKDETPEFVIKYLKMIQVRRNTTVRNIRTYNGTEFVNQTLKSYYEDAGISHEPYVASEAVSTTCYTQNRSLIRKRHNKTPYEFLHDRKPDLKYLHVFGALCYPINDSEDLEKMKPKADIGIFISYAPTKKAFRIYNRWTHQIKETIHVDFDELTAMAFEQNSSGPALHEMTPGTISLGLVQNPSPSTPYVPPTKND